MRPAVALLAFLVVSPLLAGCLGGQPQGDNPPPGTSPPGTSPPRPGTGTAPPPTPGTSPPVRPPAPRRISFGGASNEVSMAINPLNTSQLVVGAKDYSLFFAPPCTTQNVWSGVYFSTDNGRLWRHTVLPGFKGDTRPSLLTGYRCASDPLVAFDAEGMLYYAGIAFGFANDTGPVPEPPPLPVPAPPVPVPAPPVPLPNATRPEVPVEPTLIFVAKSRDGGLTWNETYAVAEDKVGAIRHDRPAFAVDRASGALYVAWSTTSGATAPNQTGVPGAPEVPAVPVDAPTAMMVRRSLDGGLTWDPQQPIPTAPPVTQVGGAALAVAPGGAVHLMFLGTDASGASAMYATTSADGAAWPPAQAVAAVTPAPSPLENSAFRVPTAPALAVDPTSGRLLAAWNDAAGGSSDIVAITSDDGASWSPPAVLHAEAGNDQFMPAAAFKADGEALVLFYDRRGDPGNKLVQVTVARSRDGGATWNETRLNQAAFDGDRSLHQRGLPFLGDYIGLAAEGTVAWAAWTATPSGRGDVYVLRLS